MQQHTLMMARYHRWATNTLLDCLRPLSDEEYRRDVGLFFGSIHGTLNHLLLAEQLWFARFRGESMAITGLDQELIANREQLVDALELQVNAWLTLIEGHEEDWLSQDFSYKNTQGITMSGHRGHILSHVFNHGTHHRGQISAAMTGLGYDAPEIDLLYHLNPNA